MLLSQSPRDIIWITKSMIKELTLIKTMSGGIGQLSFMLLIVVKRIL